MSALTYTQFSFPHQTSVYNGKVRDVYFLADNRLVMVATDRISAFDVILPKGIPYKGQILNQIAAKFLDATQDIVPNWKLATPDPMVTVGLCCKGYPVEMIVRGYLCGSAWRAYKAGVREICGVQLPEGMRENEQFPTPIITPTTKAEIGMHDEDISREQIIARGLVPADEYAQLEQYSLALFARGQQIAAEHGLILVDTKYEFGKHNGQILLMDEVHTPDSSRYFYAEGYKERFLKGEPQRQLSKEFVREWLMDNGFQGRTGQVVPEMTPEVVRSITERYIELYEAITGEKFTVASEYHPQSPTPAQRIEQNVFTYLSTLEAQDTTQQHATTILDGKLCSEHIKSSLVMQVKELLSSGARVPHLGVIQVGNNPASTTYVNNKHNACLSVGFRSTVLRLPDTISENELLQQLDAWNRDDSIDGYIVQLPLPDHIDEQRIIYAIDPRKDVDGFHPANIGKLSLSLDGLAPATPTGILTMLREYNIPLAGKHCVIIGRSNIVGRPLANILSGRGVDCTVTLCHSRTQHLREICLTADIIVTAIGSPTFLKSDMVPEGAVVIDVGINRVPADNERGYRLVGDVDYDEVAPRCSFITPVPGGVGPMTITSLLQNTLKAYHQHKSL